MCKVCVFAGTTEGRELTEVLTAAGMQVYACVATEYGGTLLEPGDNLTVSAARLTQEDMEKLFLENDFSCVVDATHPYAPIVTENIRQAAQTANVEYLRLLRGGSGVPEGCVFAENTAQAVELLKTIPGNVLLTTGSKELAAYAALPDYAQRIYARVLPVESSIAACRDTGLPASHILAMQGPFSLELNVALLHSVGASVLVTKDSGNKGGFLEKVEAAKAAGATLLVIGRPRQVEGLTFAQTVALLSEKLGFRLRPQVSIVGIGPGGREDRTLRAENAIRSADCLIGAKRMLDAVANPGQLLCTAISPEKIREAIVNNPQCRRFTVVMAGDIGFYSGTKKLLPLLNDCQVGLIPGLSSLVTLCARLGTSYEDVLPVSLHGREANIAAIVARTPRTFVLVGGENGMGKLCAHLTEFGLGHVQVSVGEQLGYPEEKITVGTAAELAEQVFHSLSVCLIEHSPEVVVTHGMPDEAFQRGSHADGSVVPMTKSEIRCAALSRLALKADSICWDIGAGTGSVTIEMARQAYRGQVYGVEKKEGALSLLAENRKRHHADNLTIVAGAAPEACNDLPAPTHVFIGGSSGNIRAILALARQKNPNVRIVATAIALETVAELTAYRKDFASSEVTVLTAAQGHKAGPYTLMQGQNPVYLFAMQGKESE